MSIKGTRKVPWKKTDKKYMANRNATQEKCQHKQRLRNYEINRAKFQKSNQPYREPIVNRTNNLGIINLLLFPVVYFSEIS